MTSLTTPADMAVLTQLKPLREYMEDPDVIEVRVNKFGQVVTETRSQGRVFHDRPDVDRVYLEELTDALLHWNGLGPHPVNNVRLPDGSRGVICWPPAVLEGTVLLAFRKHMPVTKSLEELRDEGRFQGARVVKQSDALELQPFEQQLLDILEQGDMVEFLRQAVRAKLNIVIAGSTGSGKSTFTRSLMQEVPKTERLIVLEDVHEVGSETHNEVGYMMYGDEDGRISPSECLKACMRLSPDRIIMTELRDDAAWDYLAGGNTAHPGGITSTHADGVDSVPARIATLVKASPVGSLLDDSVIMKTINTTLDVIVFMKDYQIKEVRYDPMFKKKQLAT